MHKLFIRTAVTALVAGSLAAPAFAQQVSVTLKDGRATIKAENATARQILEEWSRVGQTKLVNVDKLTGPPITISLVNVPEGQALDTVLRSAAGYMAVDRITPVANASSYERVMIMAKTTTATAAPAAAAAPTQFTGPAYTPAGDNNADEPNNQLSAQQNGAGGNEPGQNAPVVNPYAQGGAPGTATAPNGANPNAVGPDVKFDYANPVPYFERQRQLQQQQQQQQTTQPTATPSVGGGQTTTAPGIAPAPQPTQPQNQPINPYNPPANFNPYNLKPGEAVPGTTPQQQGVQPDRSKYTNPYQPTQTPTPPQQ